MRRIANSACMERRRRVSEDTEVQSVGVMETISEELEYHRGRERARRNMVDENNEENGRS